MNKTIKKVHIAGLTNLTEGRLPNEHITFAYYPITTIEVLIAKIEQLNEILPLELEHMFSPRKLRTFKSFTDEDILTPTTNYMRHEKPFKDLFKPSAIAHITLAKNPPKSWPELNLEHALNWEHGLLVDQAVAGFKVNGKLKYFTIDELIEELEK